MSGTIRQRQSKPTPIITPSGSSSSEDEGPSNCKEETSAEQQQAQPKSKPQGQLGLRFSVLDVLRILSGMIMLSCALSWFVTDGETLVWGMRPKWTRWEVFKRLFKPETILTDAQLAKYDGSDPTLPIYVALNGSVFDVSASPQTYAPGGSYNVFAGVDAVRGFVTGCFAEDRTYDLRGVEEMHLEQDDELDLYEAGKLPGYEKLSVDEKRGLVNRAKERRKKAWNVVEERVKHWDGFYRNHEKYFYVGRVVHRDLSGEPLKPLCEAAKRKKLPKEG